MQGYATPRVGLEPGALGASSGSSLHIPGRLVALKSCKCLWGLADMFVQHLAC